MQKGELMSELKPCPFCGSTDIYETYSQEYSLGTKMNIAKIMQF